MNDDVQRELRQIKWLLVGILATLIVIAMVVAIGPILAVLVGAGAWIGDLVWMLTIFGLCGLAALAGYFIVKLGWFTFQCLWLELSSLWRR
ncbi:hypothetical protein ACERK3_18275 [Phycisphaerales bacterium AB-hyl4]|uniref:Major facilitator superfamily (MFS) profile domain-containing protein n=1 Tax=Natronomicrosphaera hydrolytica TaxID=3242702 RepID=A0ABV4U9D8_9BACT